MERIKDIEIAKKGLLFGHKQEIGQFELSGFHEVVLSVRDLEASSSFYQGIAGWKEIHRSKCSKSQNTFWSLPEESISNQCLLAQSGVASGHLRIVQFNDIAQKPIRSSSQSWDTGGIYDIDLRARNIRTTYDELQAQGWSGFNDTLSYEFGKFHVSEILMKGPDDVVLAIIERHQPPLEGFPHMQQLSHIFNSSQIVRNMDAAKHFYMHGLGFEIYMEHNLTGSKEEENLFGMPQNLYRTINRKICILHPKGINSGSVELIELEGAEGKDYSKFAQPPNLGLLMLRFPVKNIEALKNHLITNDINIHRDISDFSIEPYGHCKCMAILSPDGTWLEFIELLDNFNLH